MRRNYNEAEPDNDLKKSAFDTFNQFKQQLKQIAKQSKHKQQLLKAQQRLKKLKQSSSQPQSQSTTPYTNSLLKNLIIDYLRSNNHNYTYSIFLQQSDTIPEQVVSKSKICTLLGLSEEYEKQEKFNASVLEIMVKVIQAIFDKKSNLVQFGVQNQIVRADGSQNHVLVMENRLREVREEVENRQKKYYEKMLQSMRARQILELRAQITQQMQKKYEQQKGRLQKKLGQITKNSIISQKSERQKQQIQHLQQKNREQSQKLSTLTIQLSQLKKQTQSHNCTKSPSYTALQQKFKIQRKQIQQKKKQLDYALRNINTKIEDFAEKKRKIQGDRNSDQFINGVRKAKENKDYLIQTVYSEMKRMEERVKVVAQDNQQLRSSLRLAKQKMKEKEEFCKKLEQQNSQFYNRQLSIQSVNNNQHPSTDSKLSKKQQPKSITPSYSSHSAQHSQPKKCPECLRRKPKPQTFNISIGVKGEQIDQQLQLNQQQIIKQDSSSDSDEEEYEDFENKQLQHDKKLMSIQAQMNIIKKKVLLLVDQN